jgi:hypothetical protein
MEKQNIKLQEISYLPKSGLYIFGGSVHLMAQCVKPRNQISGCFTCGLKDHRKTNCDQGGRMKKFTRWNGNVNMLTLFRDPFQD